MVILTVEGTREMGFRLRKFIRLLPGIRLNLGFRGARMSFGGPGSIIDVSGKVTRTTIGIPGAGLFYSEYRPHRADPGRGGANGNAHCGVWPLILLAFAILWAFLGWSHRMDTAPAPSHELTHRAPFEAEFSIAIDTTLYPREAVLRACYAFSDRCLIWLCREDQAFITAAFRRLETHVDVEKIKGEFANSLIDFALRVDIEARTRTVRSAIVTAALAEAGLSSSAPVADW
jgi:His-Xaa-Ser system protein HxsD